jgi:hypothetical protein
MLLDLHDKLSLLNWERVLNSQSPYTLEEGWSTRLKAEGLILDLSKVGWVEPAALVRAVLLIEGACLCGAEVTVRLPRTKPTRSEQAILASYSQSKDPALLNKASFTSLMIRRRNAAALVLEAMRLREALSHEHLRTIWGLPKIIEDYDWSYAEDRHDEASDNSEPSPDRNVNAKRLPSTKYFQVAYGLQWVPAPRSKEGRVAIDHLAEVNVLADLLLHPSGRISAADGRTLAHVFLKELVENTTDHSGRQYALVAAWSRRANVSLKETEVLNSDRAFADWCKGYPLIEVIVGDSGEGIPSTLRNEYKRQKPQRPEELAAGSENDCVLAWAFDKWSSRVTRKEKRGTRGLYRVERITRKYDGIITMRSELSYVGIDCHSDSAELTFEPKRRLARSPGTVVHVRLPVMLSEKRPERNSTRALREAEFRVLDFYGLDWSDEEAIINFISDRVLNACKEASLLRKPVCVIADLGFVSLERRVLERLLRELVEIAHPVAVVIANVKGPGGDAADETIHSLAQQVTTEDQSEATAEQQHTIHVQDAILFLHADGRFAWVGMREDVAEYLRDLWDQGELSAEELKRLLPNTEQRNTVIREFAESYHVASRRPDGGLSLRFNKQDVLEHLWEQVASRIRNVVEEGHLPEALAGICRTPSLGLVSRFVNVDLLLRKVGLDRATGILAQKCARLEEFQTFTGTIQILANWKTSRDILNSFKESLISVLPTPHNIEINQVSPRDLPVIAEDSLIILFTSVILTGDSAASLLSQVIRARRVPAIVVSVIDARSQFGSPLKALGHSIETVSLANIDVSVPANTNPKDVININPLSQLPEPAEEFAGVNYEISTRSLAQLLERHEALYFQHIVRPNGRHFCFYLDAFKLLGTLDTADATNVSDTGQRIILEFQKVIDEWLGEGASIDLICITNFPRSEKPSAAEVIASRLAKHYKAEVQAITITGEFIPLTSPRPIVPKKSEPLERPEQLALLNMPESRPPQTILIVDWGSVTGKNIRDSIRFAAIKGVSRILTVVFLSQLPAGDEQFLTQIRKVCPHNAGPDTNECEVTVKFLARFPIQSYDSLTCPYCRQIERLNKEDASYSGLLQDFHEEAKLRLRPRTLQEVREEQQASLITHATDGYILDNVNPSRHVTVLAEIRSQLEDARDSTKARYLFYESLLAMEKDIEQGDFEAKIRRSCLIRLLAVEWPWLKHEPLSLSIFKQQVSNLAVGLVLDTTCLEADRRDAVVVLRTASKERFAKHLPQLFRTLISETFLLSQLLYAAFTYLQREYLMPESLRSLVDGFEQCTQEVRERLGLSLDIEVGHTINSLFLLGLYVTDAFNEEEMDAVDAWRVLKRDWADRYNAHHPLADSIRSLFLSYFEDELYDVDQELPDIDWKGIRDKWSLVERHLIQIIRWLAPLRSVFEGLDSCGILPLGEGEQLAQAGTGEGVFRVSTLRTQLDLFANSPKSVRAYGEWETFKGARDWLWTLLLNPGRDEDGTAVEASTLITVLQGCPCDINSVVSSVLNEPARRKHPLSIQVANALDDSTKVFCHEIVLHGCLRELLLNVEKHTQKPVDQPINVIIVLEESNSNISIHITNDGFIKPSSGLRQGLIRFKQALQAYSGDLNGHEIDNSTVIDARKFTTDEPTFVYRATVTLRKW